jgi:HAD superfamily hydrolase (TIGR01549 family)
MKELLHHVAPLSGAVDLLRHLREMKVPYGIATSGERKDLEEPLKQLAIGPDTVVVCASDVEHTKPEPEPFLVCRERLNIPAEHCFAVGDTVWDMLAARRAGILGVGVLSGEWVKRTSLAQVPVVSIAIHWS